MECKIIDNPTNNMKLNIINFINQHGCTNDGNITEMSTEILDRLLSLPTILILLMNNNNIIGTIISIIIRINIDILSSYTTFLCIDIKYRKQGLALMLINAAKEEGFKKNVTHGYYMTYKNINNNIKSWYRPINIKNAVNAGFTIYNGNKTRQRLMYHIGKPLILPVKVSCDDYERVLIILKKGQLYLTPTYEEYLQLMTCLIFMWLMIVYLCYFQ